MNSHKKDVLYVHAKADRSFSEATLQITLSQRENYTEMSVFLYVCVHVLFFLKAIKRSLCWVRHKLFTSFVDSEKVARRQPFFYLNINLCWNLPEMPNSSKLLERSSTYPRHTYLVPFTTYPRLKMKSATTKIKSLRRSHFFFNGEKYPTLQKPQTDLFHKQPCMEQLTPLKRLQQNKIKKN